MEIHLKYTNIEPDGRIEEYIAKKITPLGKLLSGAAALHAWVEVGRITRHHKEGKVWYAECQIKLPSKQSFYVNSTQNNIFFAIDEVREGLERIIHTFKERQKSKLREKRVNKMRLL